MEAVDEADAVEEAPAKKRKHDKKELNGSVEEETVMEVADDGDESEVKSKKSKKKKNKSKDAENE